MSISYMLDLSPHYNNRGFTKYENRKEGRLTIGNASLPAEQIKFGHKYSVNGIPFSFYTTELGDNVEHDGQTVIIPSLNGHRLCRMHFLGLSDNGDHFDSVTFWKDDCLVYEGKIELSDLLSEQPVFTDLLALKLPYIHYQSGIYEKINPSVWHYILDYPEDVAWPDRIVLGENMFMHTFAVTLEYKGEQDGTHTLL